MTEPNTALLNVQQENTALAEKLDLTLLDLKLQEERAAKVQDCVNSLSKMVGKAAEQQDEISELKKTISARDSEIALLRQRVSTLTHSKAFKPRPAHAKKRKERDEKDPIPSDVNGLIDFILTATEKDVLTSSEYKLVLKTLDMDDTHIQDFIFKYNPTNYMKETKTAILNYNKSQPKA